MQNWIRLLMFRKTVFGNIFYIFQTIELHHDQELSKFWSILLQQHTKIETGTLRPHLVWGLEFMSFYWSSKWDFPVPSKIPIWLLISILFFLWQGDFMLILCSSWIFKVLSPGISHFQAYIRDPSSDALGVWPEFLSCSILGWDKLELVQKPGFSRKICILTPKEA